MRYFARIFLAIFLLYLLKTNFISQLLLSAAITYLALLVYSNFLEVKLINVTPPTVDSNGEVTIRIKNLFLPFAALVSIQSAPEVKEFPVLVSFAPFEEKEIKVEFHTKVPAVIYAIKVFPFFFPFLDFVSLPVKARLVFPIPTITNLQLKAKVASIIGGEIETKKKVDEGLDFYGVEKYFSGPARFINWKKTAQYGEPYKNVFLLTGKRKVIVGLINSVINFPYFWEMLAILNYLYKKFEKEKIILVTINSDHSKVFVDKQVKSFIINPETIPDLAEEVLRKLERKLPKIVQKTGINLDIKSLALLGFEKLKPKSYKMELEEFVKAKGDIKVLITSENYPIRLPNAINIIVGKKGFKVIKL